MKVKIDTKERFHVITIQEPVLSANMTELLENKLSEILKDDIKNVVLNLKDTESLDNVAITAIAALQQEFYRQRASFVICCIQAGVKTQLEAAGLAEELNTAPTESEAMDIVQMEEIERELDEE